uniref:Uncharacterized protein n=1 Tax=Arundo donax TaxID=35708 RepID=A0A0A8Z653_ARUDO
MDMDCSVWPVWAWLV